MMQEKNNKSSSSNEGALLSVFFLTLSLVNLQGIYRLQWLKKHETSRQVLLIEGYFQKIENLAKAAFSRQCDDR